MGVLTLTRDNRNIPSVLRPRLMIDRVMGWVVMWIVGSRPDTNTATPQKRRLLWTFWINLGQDDGRSALLFAVFSHFGVRNTPLSLVHVCALFSRAGRDVYEA
jgi:hypothetical protein